MTSALIEHARFQDRAAVGRRLAKLLSDKHYEKPVVLALPRGGVPVAVEIAATLKAPLDLLLVRKIGAPGHEELALGAVVDGQDPHVFINEGIRHACNVSDSQLDEIKATELREIERRRSLYLHERHPVDLEGTTTIVVDDGIATGATVHVALDALRLRKPARLVVAAGVASPEAVGHIRSEVDEIVCLAQPDPMHAISLYYEDFRQLSDEEVVRLLAGFP